MLTGDRLQKSSFFSLHSFVFLHTISEEDAIQTIASQSVRLATLASGVMFAAYDADMQSYLITNTTNILKFHCIKPAFSAGFVFPLSQAKQFNPYPFRRIL